jgi:hypothetical protein
MDVAACGSEENTKTLSEKMPERQLPAGVGLYRRPPLAPV